MLPPVSKNIPIPPGVLKRSHVYGFHRLKEPNGEEIDSMFIPGAKKENVNQSANKFKLDNKLPNWNYATAVTTEVPDGENKEVLGVRIWRLADKGSAAEQPKESVKGVRETVREIQGGKQP